MRNTVIPAQVTTVEDKITGNLNLTQVLLLTTPVLLAMILFTLIPPIMKCTGIKIIFSLFFLFICLALAVRVKGRVVLEWLSVFLRFKQRPDYYIFDKNDNYLRETEKIMEKKDNKTVVKKAKSKSTKNVLAEEEKVKFFDILNNQKNSLSFEFNQKGGLHVAMEKR
jgi:hypothetical protein